MVATKKTLHNFTGVIKRKSFWKIAKNHAIIILLLLITIISTVPSFAKNATDTADENFHDKLLDQLVGAWDVAAVAHGEKFTLDLEAAWVMDHPVSAYSL